MAAPGRDGGSAPKPAKGQAPNKIGPFTIVERVATSAFTVTYRAEQPAAGRTVLVKALKPSVSATSSFADELTREAAVLGRLEHEGVVRLYEIVRAEGAVYLVLEDTHAVALAHVHERGVVHRAVSTTSIQVTPAGRLLLTDFDGAAATSVTFQAPEQILGETAGPAADVWALGIVCHVLLGGDSPFADGERREAAKRIRTTPASPLPDGAPAPLARAVARSLAKDPADRFADGRALAQALEDGLGALARSDLRPILARALGAPRASEAQGTAPARAPAAPRGPPAGAIDLVRLARNLGLVSLVMLMGLLAIRALDDREGDAGDGIAESPAPGLARRDAGLVRVVARPWAEVYIDGERVDVTPIGRPIAVTPGRHYVTFRHPAAPDEQRSIKIAAGQSVFLDVTMRVDRGDAGTRDASAAPPSP